MENSIIGIIFIVAGIVFLKLIGNKEGIVMMIICGILGVILLICAIFSS